MSRISSPIFVGRTAEIASLERAWSDVCAGSGRLRLIHGEAGIGKTRLIAELKVRFGESGGTVHRGRCLDLGEGMLPFGPVVEVMRSIVVDRVVQAGADIPSAASEALDALIPRPDARNLERPTAGPITGQGRLFACVAEAMTEAAAEAPRAVVIEDAHWLDPASRDMIRFLAHALRDAPVLLILTVRDDMARDDPTAAMLAELAREPHAMRLDLPRFTADEVGHQLRGILNGEPSADLVMSVHARSGGNPFYAEEVVALDIASSTSVPPSLRDMLLSHLADADAVARRLLDAASVGGRWVPDERLRAVVALDGEAFNVATRALVAAQFLLPEDRPEGSGLAFRHALVRDAVYDDLLPAERRGWHAAWAEIGVRDPAATAAVADHLAAAGMTDRAAFAYIAAADVAQRSLAHAEAVRLFERAEALLPSDRRGTEQEGVLLERLAGSAEASGRRSRAIEALQSAVELPFAKVQPAFAGRLHRQLAELAMFAGRDDIAFESLTRGQQALASLPDDPESGRLLANLALLHLLAGRLDESRMALDVAAGAVSSSEDPIARARVDHVGAVLIGLDDPTAGVEALRAAGCTAATTGQLGIQLQAGLDLAWMLITLGRFDAALAAVDDVTTLARTNGTESWVEAACAMYSVECLGALGRWSDIESLVDKVERSERGFFARIALALHMVDRGRPDAARRLAQEGLAGLPHESGDAAYRLARAQGEVAIAGADGDRATILEAAERAGDLHGEDDLAADLALRGIQAGAEILRGPDRSPAVFAATERLRRRLREIAERPGHAASRSIQACHVTATAELAALDGSDPIQAWERGAAAWRDLGWLHRVAYCRYREAEARLVAGRDRRLAEAGVREAHAISVELGAEPLRLEIESLARRARVSFGADRHADRAAGSPPIATPADPHGLTEREHEVLGLMISGRTNREIGATLFISPKTAGVHVSNILGKFGAANRVEAASIAHRLGMLASDAEAVASR